MRTSSYYRRTYRRRRDASVFWAFVIAALLGIAQLLLGAIGTMLVFAVLRDRGCMIRGLGYGSAFVITIFLAVLFEAIVPNRQSSS